MMIHECDSNGAENYDNENMATFQGHYMMQVKHATQLDQDRAHSLLSQALTHAPLPYATLDP